MKSLLASASESSSTVQVSSSISTSEVTSSVCQQMTSVREGEADPEVSVKVEEAASVQVTASSSVTEAKNGEVVSCEEQAAINKEETVR